MQNSLVNRLMGIVTFKAPIYKEIAKDTTATTSALIVVVVVAVATGVVSGAFAGNTFLGIALTAILSQLVGWVIGAWVLAFASKTFFQGTATTQDMLRINGFTSIFQILAIIPLLGIIGSILQIVANILGIREAAEITTGKAVLTAIIAGIIVFVVSAVIATIIAAIFIVPIMLSQ